MTEGKTTSLERVLATLGHREPDRVPWFLLVTMHGAKELGMSIREYFSRAEHVAEGQLRLREKYRHDCLYSFFYAPVEIEAWGSEVVYAEDGPPNSGTPFLRRPEDIERLEPPRIEECPCLVKVLRATEMLKARAGATVPIVGVVMSPLSLPVMQMGFDGYLDLMFERPELFAHLMRVNEEHCVAWANAQLKAGATAICYFDPLSSTTIIPRDQYLTTGFEVAGRTLARINGPTATHLASGRCLPIVDDLARTGTAIIGTSVLEDLAEMKAACRGKLTVLGNLNGIEMRRWSAGQAEAAVKQAIAKAAPGGGYILSDNHGEIPWQVPDEVLQAMSEAVHKWGRYPLEWTREHGG
ncbi:MAG: methylcobamide--CoM methyltransferase MtbA [bacterium]|nr:methylcobamide--CoM methyltransferase MtbA [bacterium]